MYLLSPVTTMLTLSLQPDFGDMMGELKIKRAERAKAEQARRDELKRQFEEQKRKEAEALAKEMEVCR